MLPFYNRSITSPCVLRLAITNQRRDVENTSGLPESKLNRLAVTSENCFFFAKSANKPAKQQYYWSA